jgi:hypothetical protein
MKHLYLARKAQQLLSQTIPAGARLYCHLQAPPKVMQFIVIWEQPTWKKPNINLVIYSINWVDQLEPPSDEAAIRKFCTEHNLLEHERLPDAKFWTPAQAQFLRESWQQDADWAELIDQLNSSLRA